MNNPILDNKRLAGRVSRGGFWWGFRQNLRTDRYRIKPSYQNLDLGFRIVRNKA